MMDDNSHETSTYALYHSSMDTNETHLETVTCVDKWDNSMLSLDGLTATCTDSLYSLVASTDICPGGQLIKINP